MLFISLFFPFQYSTIEKQHALIDFDVSQGCFILQDLNSANGTYVNEHRVQNSAVRLAPGDIIRFGFGILLNLLNFIKYIIS